MTEPPTIDHLVLVDRAQRGDASAWEGLYNAHEGALYSFIYHRVGRDRALADDVFHDSFLKAVQRIRQFDSAKGEFGAWLTGIARNELRQRARSAARAPTQELSPQIAAADDPVPGDVGEGVNLAFSALSARHQQVLALKYQQGETLDSIAATLGSTPAAVGSLLHRARAAFRQAYAKLAGGSA